MSIQKVTHSFGLLLVSALALVSAAHAGGQLPPPSKPVNFQVVITSGAATGVWATQQDVTYFLFEHPATQQSVGAGGQQSNATLAGPFDMSEKQVFTLTAFNVGGRSESAVFTYVPPTVGPIDVPFTAVNTSSRTLYGYLTIGTVQGGPTVRYDVGPNATVTGTLPIDPRITYWGYSLRSNPRDVVGGPTGECLQDFSTQMSKSTNIKVTITAPTSNTLACTYNVVP